MGTADTGLALLWVAAGAGLMGAAIAVTERLNRRGFNAGRLAVAVRVVIVAALAGATGCLAWSFVRVDAALLEVAEGSQRGRPFLERLAGLWGTSRPSLLVWVTLVAITVSLPLRFRRPRVRPPVQSVPDGTSEDPPPAERPGRRAHRGEPDLPSTVLLAALSGLVLAVHPFRLLPVPAIDGRGLQPILRHPAMSIHPPLLYLAQALAIAGALRPARWRLHFALGVGAAALTLGAGWAYSELGWGGFWAWDPVENAGLLPWLALLAAVHAPRGQARKGLIRLAGILALAGAALTRSGRGVSVHTFAPDGAVGTVLWALVATGVIAAMGSGASSWRARRVPEAFASPAPGPSPWRAYLVPGLICCAVAVVAAGTFGPLLATRRIVTGAFFARSTLPIGVVLLALLVVSRPSAARVAHLGALALAAGILGTVLGRDGRAWIHPGESASVAGFAVRLTDLSATAEPASSPRSREVRARLTVEGRRLVPHADEWTGWDDPLAETASTRIGVSDVQVVLRQVIEPDGTKPAALIEVHTRPLLWFVWIGGAMLAVGSITSAQSKRKPPKGGRPPWCSTPSGH